MSAVIGWIAQKLAALLGGWAGFALAAVAAAVLAGGLVHTWDAARHRAEVAEIRAANLTAIEEQGRRTLLAERAQLDALQSKDNAYAQLADARETAAVESARLSGELDTALERLRRIESRPAAAPGGMSAAAAAADGCQDLRAARDRAVAALELLIAEGSQAARDPDASPIEVRRELDYLGDRKLVELRKDPAGPWWGGLTRYGTDLAEYTVDCDPGIARPKKYW